MMEPNIRIRQYHVLFALLLLALVANTIVYTFKSDALDKAQREVQELRGDLKAEQNRVHLLEEDNKRLLQEQKIYQDANVRAGQE